MLNGLSWLTMKHSSREKRVLFTINFLWACLSLPREISPPSPEWKCLCRKCRSPAHAAHSAGESCRAPPWGGGCTFQNTPPFSTASVVLVAFRISGQKVLEWTPKKRLCDYLQGWPGPCKLPSRNSAWEGLAQGLHTLHFPSWLCPPRWRIFPFTGTWFSGQMVGKGTRDPNDPETELTKHSHRERGQISLLLEQPSEHKMLSLC